MCEFPSWCKFNNKNYWLTDKDIERAIEDGKIKSWLDSTGHNAINLILGINGINKEGRDGLPEEFANDIKSGKCNRMAKVEPKYAFKYVYDLLPEGLQLFDPNLKELDLSDINLTELPVEIGKLKNLQTLYLSDNKLIELPKEIGKLKNLQILYL